MHIIIHSMDLIVLHSPVESHGSCAGYCQSAKEQVETPPTGHCGAYIGSPDLWRGATD